MNIGQKKSLGFSLLEMLIVLALVSLTLYLSFGQLRFLKRGYACAELDSLYQTCLYMQRHAMVTGKTCDITLNLVDNSYQFNNQQCQLAQGIQFDVLPYVKGPPSTPTKLLSKPCSFKNNHISFSKDGSMSAGAVYITDVAHNCLYALSSSVSSYSYLRKYRYAGKWHQLD
ncbi:MAG: prepilin-type N-terminal cleavage/methylation domain-containing protein [Candidatus Dependentiae bacterium]